MALSYTRIQKTALLDGFSYGGEGGIRTLDSREAILDFESSAFDHSATSPFGR
jgi:hypothetical protein